MSKEKLLEGLNQDLSYELQTIITYITYGAKATGPHNAQLRDLFTSDIQEEITHAQFLADKIVALGGTPTTEPAPVKEASTNEEMLKAALEGEITAIEGYKERANQAEEFGDLGLQNTLEDMTADETNHKEEIERFLRNWNEG